MNAIEEIHHLTALTKLYLFQEHPALRVDLAKAQSQARPAAEEQVLRVEPIAPAKLQIDPPPTVKSLQATTVQNRAQIAPTLKNVQAHEPIKTTDQDLPAPVGVPQIVIDSTKWVTILKEKFPNQVVLPQATAEKPAVQNFQSIVLFCPPPLSPEEVEMLKRLFKAISDQLSPAAITSTLNPDDPRLNTTRLLLAPKTRLHEFAHLKMQKIALNPIHEYLQNNALKASLWKELTFTWQKLSS